MTDTLVRSHASLDDSLWAETGTIYLTGITTTGAPHLGNYVGAIRPAIQASMDHNVLPFYFLADYHALIKCQDPVRVQESTFHIAATWLALGLDTGQIVLERLDVRAKSTRPS